MTRLKYSFYTFLYGLALLAVIVSYVLQPSTTYFYTLIAVIVVLGIYAAFTLKSIAMAKKYKHISEPDYHKGLWLGFLSWIGFAILLLMLILTNVGKLLKLLGI
jgi:hypothetical protein